MIFGEIDGKAKRLFKYDDKDEDDKISSKPRDTALDKTKENDKNKIKEMVKIDSKELS